MHTNVYIHMYVCMYVYIHLTNAHFCTITNGLITYLDIICIFEQ